MSPRKPLWDIFTEERKKYCLDKISAYFENERGEKIGMLAAQDIFDVVIEGAFSEIYNKGVLDAQKIIRDKNADIESELDALLRLKG